MLMTHAGVDFIDNLLQKNLIDKMSDLLPVLEIDGQILNQSEPIHRYLGIKYGYYSTEPMEAYQSD